MKPTPHTYVLTIVSTPHHLPETPRLRALLKTMLRRYGFKCLRVTAGEAAGVPRDARIDLATIPTAPCTLNDRTTTT